MSGEIKKRIQFKVEHDFAGVGEWANVWLGARLGHGLSVRAGNFTAPFSLEKLQNSNTIPFTERSVSDALSPGYAQGVQVSLHRHAWTATGGFFGDALKNDAGLRPKRGAGFVGRLTFAPAVGSADILHLGAAFEHRNLDTDDSLRLAAGPEVAFSSNLIRTHRLSSASEYERFGLEGAWAHRSILLQAQALETQVKRTNGPGVRFWGGYAQASWVLTGETYGYSRTSGVFTGVNLKPGKSSVELSARYSVLDLNSHDSIGGVARDFTAGMNWYINRNFRIMLDYVRSDVDNLPSNAKKTTANAFALRLQTAF